MDPQYVAVQRPNAVQILDWTHASGYVHAAGHAVFGEQCGQWCDTQLGVLRHAEPIAVLVELARLQDSLPEEDPARNTVAHSLTYLAKRFDQIHCATFTGLGYPIRGGIVESANRTVVQARLKGAGMHWAMNSVNPLLALRSAVCSDAGGRRGLPSLANGAALNAINASTDTKTPQPETSTRARTKARATTTNYQRPANTGPPLETPPPT